MRNFLANKKISFFARHQDGACSRSVLLTKEGKESEANSSASIGDRRSVLRICA
jgi:hypothetical protein